MIGWLRRYKADFEKAHARLAELDSIIDELEMHATHWIERFNELGEQMESAQTKAEARKYAREQKSCRRKMVRIRSRLSDCLAEYNQLMDFVDTYTEYETIIGIDNVFL